MKNRCNRFRFRFLHSRNRRFRFRFHEFWPGTRFCSPLVTTLKNNRTMCISEYHEFKAKEGESLKDTYSRFNILINKCKRSGVIRTNEDNNMLFLKSLGTEWLHLTMSMRTNLDLEIMSLADLYGSLASLEPQVLQLKSSIGGPLALMAESGKGKGEKRVTEEKKKKKKTLSPLPETITEVRQEEEEVESMREEEREVEEVKMKEGDIMTEEDMTEEILKEKERSEKEQRTNETREDPQRAMEGCFRSRKPGHYAAECWAIGPMAPQKLTAPHRLPQKPKQDATYFKKKAEYYNKKVLLAQSSELVTDESSGRMSHRRGWLPLRNQRMRQSSVKWQMVILNPQVANPLRYPCVLKLMNFTLRSLKTLTHIELNSIISKKS
ncbi:hypothetical protein OSB04_030973 [Centaurea solstitialis]|uniref:Uncharacterized protein n=1 Tax=Centaurea solstitialis TaxID=347529 RepID=A0AA38SLA5_9ASTR|nr:hypothetical protein OSB04_030973 [Centaurea solstitialis]